MKVSSFWLPNMKNLFRVWLRDIFNANLFSFLVNNKNGFQPRNYKDLKPFFLFSHLYFYSHFDQNSIFTQRRKFYYLAVKQENMMVSAKNR